MGGSGVAVGGMGVGGGVGVSVGSIGVAAIPVLASDLKSASISVYLEQEKRDGNQLVPLWSQGRESFQWQRISFYRQILYSH